MARLSTRNFSPNNWGLKVTYRSLVLFTGLLLWETQAIAPVTLLGRAAHAGVKRVGAVQGGQDLPQLELGKPIERELTGGQAHNYQIRLAAGQYLHVVVEQRGIDVAVELFGSDNRRLAKSDTYRRGIETISVVAQAPGACRLEVRSTAESAPSGRYLVSLKELREATTEDNHRIAAEREAKRLVAEAEQLQAQKSPESAEKAIEKYEESLLHCRAALDQRREAYTLNRIAMVYSERGKKEQALDYHLRALTLLRVVEDRAVEASTLSEIGRLHAMSLENKQAVDYFEQSLSLFRSLESPAHEDRAVEAATLTLLGGTRVLLGEAQRGLNHLDQALSLWVALKEPFGEAQALRVMGGAYFLLDKKRSAEYFKRAEEIMRAGATPGGEVAPQEKDQLAAANAFADAASLSAERTPESLPKAIEKFEEARQYFRAMRDSVMEAQTLYFIASAYFWLGEKRKALDYFNQSLSLWQILGNRPWEAFTLSAIGEIHYLIGEQQQAIESLSQAIPRLRSIGLRYPEAAALYHLARAESDRGNLNEARDLIEAGLKIIESLRTEVVSQELRASYFSSMQGSYEFYIDLLMRLHRLRPSDGRDAAALEAGERARARSLLELLTEARADIRQGVDAALLDRDRELQQRLNATQMRLLTGKLTDKQAAAIKKETEELLAQCQQVETQIKTVSPRYAALMRPQSLSLAEIQRQTLDADTLLLEYALGEERSYLWALSTTDLVSFELPARSVIEDATLRLRDLLIETGRHAAGETSKQRRQRLAQAEVAYQTQAAALSRMLLAPVASRLGTKRLLIVGDGALQYLPFTALPAPATERRGDRETGRRGDGERGRMGDKGNPQSAIRNPQSFTPLILRHEIISLPSASTLAALRRELAGRPIAPKTVAVLADPVFEPTDLRVNPGARAAQAPAGGQISTAPERIFPRLPYTRREAAGIIALAPAHQRKLALGFEVNHQTATSEELGAYRYVHFATHGWVDNARPALSAILLSMVDEEGRKREDGLLRLGEIYNLKLPVEMVALSACSTAVGENIKGEGLVGLTRGFMYAGAARVTASLWQADDQATAELMKRFYRGMLGEQRLRPAAALRAAQITMSKQKQWQAPYYWAAFVLQGEWR